MRSKNDQEPACRFGYPIECSSQTSLTFTVLPNDVVRATVSTARDDPRVNAHNSIMLQHWRGNCDLQFVVDVSKCARYMTKYIAKCEPRSKAASEIYSKCIQHLNPVTANPATSAVRKCIIQCVGERDYGAQVTAHILLSLPLYSCTFNFVTRW